MNVGPRPVAVWLAMTLSLAAAAPAADWPQIRGPHRHGSTEEPGLLAAWDGSRPAEVWRRPIGAGYSGVSAVGERLFTMDTDGLEEAVLCLHRDTGETLWRATVGEFLQTELGDGGPRSTPAVVDGIVYAVSSRARLVALAADDGRLLWDRDLHEWGPTPRFGYAVSPLVDGDQVIVEVGQPKQEPGIASFDRRGGELRWTALSGPTGYSSPIVAEIAGVRQYVFFRAAGREVVALDPDGRLLWRHAVEGLSIIPMPIFQPPDRIFVSTSEDAMGGLMLRVSQHGGEFRVEEIWSERLMRNHFNSSVLVDGHLYGFDNGTFRCLDAATGEHRWAQRGFGKGSLVAGGGLLYVLGDDGSLALVPADPAAYREAGRVRATKGRAWTAPSLANGRLYLRDFDEIVSFDVAGDAGAGAPAPAAEGRP